MTNAEKWEVVVIGAGPAGATAARIAAARGLKVLLIDKRQELGAPIQCSGAVSAHALTDSGLEPDPQFISAHIFGFAVYDRCAHPQVWDYRLLKPQKYESAPLGYVVDRRRFDRHLAALAEREGAELWLKTTAVGLDNSDRDDAVVKIQRLGSRLNVRAPLVIAADGLQSQVGKWAGLHTHIRAAELASCLQYVVDGVKCDGLLELFVGREWAPGGYAWIFPKGDGLAEVGLGVIRTLTDHDARWHLDHFMKAPELTERFAGSSVLEVQGGGVPLAAPLRRQYADHLILAGDAARQVNPLTGGGIHTALRCGMIAGNFAADFLPLRRPALAGELAEYQRRWAADIGDKMWKLYRVKREIFRRKDPREQDSLLHRTLADYFSPTSDYRKL